MKSIEKLGQVVSTDVLVLGGGLSGLCAAIKAKESPVDVLVLDKGGIGWAGQVPISYGGVLSIRPERIDDWVKRTVAEGDYLNNQDWTYNFARVLHKSIIELDALGVPFEKSNGEVATRPQEEDCEEAHFEAPRSMVKLKRSATARGVRTLDKIYVIDLLRRQGAVIGAIGLDLVDGKTCIFHAKTVIIAVGSSHFQHDKACGVTTGEGPAMAYRAGAQLMNAEFANIYIFGIPILGMQFRKDTALWLENTLGERILEKHYPEVKEDRLMREDLKQVVDAMAIEVEAGRGPIYLDMNKLTPEQKYRFRTLGKPKKLENPWTNIFTLMEKKGEINPEKDKIEMKPMFIGGGGPIRVDLDCRTTVEGLWAAGDAASLGCGWTGACSSGTKPGRGQPFAFVSGFLAGQSAGRYAATTKRLKINLEEAEKVKERVLAPLGQGGDIDVRDVIYQVHEAIVPLKYNFHREAGRLKEALTIIDKAKDNLARVVVKDYHELARYHQAESMAMAAEFILRSSLIREESRGSHIREDFPSRDDKNWLKWIVIRQRKGDARFSTEPVPLDKYKLKP
jgi:succinate dehydrogenase / fumarate reductase flavoprotein subunit